MRINVKVVLLCVGFFLVAMISSFFTNRLLRESLPKGVTFVSSSDPELDNAIATAQESLPNFLSKLANPDGRKFAVKVRFFAPNDPRITEMMWVDHLKVKGQSWKGLLADQPVRLTKLRKGFPVQFKTTQIVDWEIIYRDGTHNGAFTDDVLRREGKE